MDLPHLGITRHTYTPSARLHTQADDSMLLEHGIMPCIRTGEGGGV